MRVMFNFKLEARERTSLKLDTLKENLSAFTNKPRTNGNDIAQNR